MKAFCIGSRIKLERCISCSLLSSLLLTLLIIIGWVIGSVHLYFGDICIGSGCRIVHVMVTFTTAKTRGRWMRCAKRCIGFQSMNALHRGYDNYTNRTPICTLASAFLPCTHSTYFYVISKSMTICVSISFYRKRNDCQYSVSTEIYI